MAPALDTPRNAASGADRSAEVDLALTDLGPLAWVLDELRKAVGSATRALRRFVQDAEGLSPSERSSADASQLRIARQQLHQAAGAMDMVGQAAPAGILRAMEGAAQQCIQRPELCNDDAVGRMERAGFGLLQYLEAVLQGKPASPVALFPQYRDVQALAGHERAHPADLWPMEWRWVDPDTLGTAPPVSPLAYDAAVRARFEQAVLKVIKSQDVAAARLLRDISLGFSAAQTARQPLVFWKIAAGFFEALSMGLCPFDVHIKRATSRVLQQYTALVRGELGVSDRLAQDLVFFCAQAQPALDAPAPVLEAVRRGFGLAGWRGVDYEISPFGRFDPALLTQARKRIGSAKEAWSSVAGGDLARMRGLTDQFSLVADSLVKLHPPSTALALALTRSAEGTARSGAAPSTALAMEVATSVMFLEAAFEELDPADVQLARRTSRLAQRLERVQSGGEPEPLEPWIEELYRRVSDRQTMGSVVGELRTALGDVERSLDQYFRNPKDASLLVTLPGQLSQMRGVMSVLGLDQAVRAVLRMRDTVEQLIGDEADTELARTNGTFDKLGNNLGALGLLFDMLNYQPALAKKLFVYDEAEGELKPLMGRVRAVTPTAMDDAVAQRVADSAAELPDSTDGQGLRQFLPTNFDATGNGLLDAPYGFQPTALAAEEFQASRPAKAGDRFPLRPRLEDLPTDLLELPLGLTEAGSQTRLEAQLLPVTLPSPQPPAVVDVSALDIDEDDLQGIFLEEAREVVENGHAAVRELADNPSDLDQQTVLRRAFHTLKGSSRMVGLADYGEAAWSMEQLLNTWLADRRSASQELRVLSQEALDCFGQWAEDIAQGDTRRWTVRMFQSAADALRLENRLQAIQSSQPSVATAHELHDFAAALQSLPSLELPVVVQESVSPLPALVEPTLDLEFPVEALAEPSFESLPPSAEELSPESIALEFPEFFEDFDAVHRADAPLPELADVDLESLDAFMLPVPAPVSDETPPFEMEASALEPEWLFDVADQEPEPEALSQALAVEPTADQLDADILAAFEAEIASTGAGQPALETEGTPASLAEMVEAAELPTLDMLADLGDVNADDHDEQTKVIGSLHIGIPLYNVYLNEADEWSRRLLTELSEWKLESHQRPVSEAAVSLAHSLAGSSATVGFVALSGLARELEHALQWTQLQSTGTQEEGRAYSAAAEDIRRLLHQFAAGFLKEPNADILETLRQLHADKGGLPVPPSAALTIPLLSSSVQAVDLTPVSALIAPQWTIPVPAQRSDAFDEALDDDDIEAADALDPDLFQIFEEEANDLLPLLGGALRQWVFRPDNSSARAEALRVLHTLKGSARLAGAMRLGERAHRMETAIEGLDAGGEVKTLEPLLARFDALQTSFETLRLPPEAVAGSTGLEDALVGARTVAAAAPNGVELHAAVPIADEAGHFATQPVSAPREVDTAEPEVSTASETLPFRHAVRSTPIVPHAAARQAVRIRSQLLDRLVNQTGEVMMTRSRLEAGVGQLRASMVDLTGNLERLRQQLRDIELQAELQMQSRLAHTKEAERSFDPLEFDRFTRVQELTRMMAESVNDVATVQRNLERTLDGADADLVAQARQTRELQRDLLRTRMQEFETLAERLYRVVRQASKDSGKQVKLDITGGSIEMDRGVLDRMTPAFEHLLRNAVAHGIEPASEREAAGKPVAGTILIELHHEGNDVAIAFSDDGAGLNRASIHDKALALKLITADQALEADDLLNLIFVPGFSTASQVTELSGRGIGMDVVRSEVQALGGRIEASSHPAKGTRFNLILPLTTAVTQVVMVRVGRLAFGIPANVVEQVRRVPSAELSVAYTTESLGAGSDSMAFYWAGALLQSSGRSDEPILKTASVVVLRSAQQRVALHVDEVLGNQEVVVKNLGPQLSRLPGLSGLTVLPSGAVVLIYNPVALASVYGMQAREYQRRQSEVAVGSAGAGSQGLAPGQGATMSPVPLVLVVDDSITVRRVTQRLLQREGYRVVLAVDGVQAMERLRAEVPAVMLSDIEMPRMDGFELARSVRSNPALKALPIITISSRMAEKHRQMAQQIGVNHYLGKPYGEEELLSLIRRYAKPSVIA